MCWQSISHLTLDKHFPSSTLSVSYAMAHTHTTCACCATAMKTKYATIVVLISALKDVAAPNTFLTKKSSVRR